MEEVEWTRHTRLAVLDRLWRHACADLSKRPPSTVKHPKINRLDPIKALRPKHFIELAT